MLTGWSSAYLCFSLVFSADWSLAFFLPDGRYLLTE